MSFEITHREVMEFAGLTRGSSTDIRIHTFGSGNAHMDVEVSGLAVCLVIKPADLRKLGEAALRAADVAEQVEVAA